MLTTQEFAGKFDLHRIEGVGTFGPYEFAGLARLLEPYYQEVLDAGHKTDPTELGVSSGALFILQLCRDDPAGSFTIIEPDGIGAEHSEKFVEYPLSELVPHAQNHVDEFNTALRNGEEPWFPFSQWFAAPGLQILSSELKVAEGDGAIYKVPPPVRRKAAQKVAEVCGGFMPVLINAEDELGYKYYLGAYANGQHPESRPSLGSTYAGHDRRPGDHGIGAFGSGPVLQRETVDILNVALDPTESPGRLSRLLPWRSQKPIDPRLLCPSMDMGTGILTRYLTDRNFMAFMALGGDSPDRIVDSLMVSGADNRYGSYSVERYLEQFPDSLTREISPDVIRVAGRQLVATMVYVRHAGFDMAELPEVHEAIEKAA